ncbi:MAG: 50S ribosomal protein L11 methyltransferase [Clostridia bacterium]|nr:50S ribosomal protein L11 methyltransferase [Clostridia bacterium]
MGMKWLELAVYTTDAGIEPVSAALTGVGITGLSIEESHASAFAFLKEAAVFWDFADMEKIGVDTPCVKGYLADCPENLPIVDAAKAAIERLRSLQLGFDLGTLAMTVVTVDEEDWANNWKKYYKPLEIGERLLVLPSWEEQPTTDRTVLKLDPGMAFGTGAHHTTRMCLEFLEQVVKDGDTMLDLGCGSGILSIASLLLGAKEAIAVDIDPIAEKIAYENAAMNGITKETFSVLIGNVLSDARVQTRIRGKYPVVAANIVADVIIALSPLAKELVAEGGAFIVSGIIDERVGDVVCALQKSGFTVSEQHSAEGWNAFLCR